MSFNRKGMIVCDSCGRFCVPHDQEVPFGCKDHENPEPLDPYHYCKKCFQKQVEYWENHFSAGMVTGSYEKSKAERVAAKKAGLIWVGSGGIGLLGTRYFSESHRYISKKVYDRLKTLPYYGWCMKCGSERYGGYCSSKKCSESFKMQSVLCK